MSREAGTCAAGKRRRYRSPGVASRDGRSRAVLDSRPGHQPPPPVSFDGVPHRCCPASNLPLRNELIKELDNLIAQANLNPPCHIRRCQYQDSQWPGVFADHACNECIRVVLPPRGDSL